MSVIGLYKSTQWPSTQSASITTCRFVDNYGNIDLTWVLKAPKPQQKKANKLLKGIPLDCSVNSENVGV